MLYAKLAMVDHKTTKIFEVLCSYGIGGNEFFLETINRKIKWCVVTEMINNFQKHDCRMSIKIPNGENPENRDIRTRKKKYEGKWDIHTMANHFWKLQISCPFLHENHITGSWDFWHLSDDFCEYIVVQSKWISGHFCIHQTL